MAEVMEPQSAADYDDRTTAAVKSVLLEIGQILGSYQGKFAVIGGSVPWLLLSDAEMAHVGLVDPLCLFSLEADLNGFVSVVLDGFLLDDCARPCLDHRYGNHFPFGIEHLGHAKLFPQNTGRHCMHLIDSFVGLCNP